jgi:hypothetical protein
VTRRRNLILTAVVGATAVLGAATAVAAPATPAQAIQYCGAPPDDCGVYYYAGPGYSTIVGEYLPDCPLDRWGTVTAYTRPVLDRCPA